MNNKKYRTILPTVIAFIILVISAIAVSWTKLMDFCIFANYNSLTSKMKKISIFPLICLMLFILSCNSQPDHSCQTISVSMDNQRKCDDIMSKIEILPLDTAKNAYMSSIGRCVIDDEHSFFH